MLHISPSYRCKTFKCRLLLVFAFLALPFVCHSAATADTLRYDGYYLSDVPHPTVKSFTAPAKPQYEYIKFYPDGAVTWVMISSNPDPKTLKQLFDAFIKDSTFTGRYTRDGDSVQVSIPMGYFQATGQSGADTLELQETLVEQRYSQQYHFVALTPPAANEPSQPKAPPKQATAAELRYDGYYLSVVPDPLTTSPPLTPQYEYIKFYPNGAVTWFPLIGKQKPEDVNRYFDAFIDSPLVTGHYTRNGDLVQFALTGQNKFEARGRIGAESLELQETHLKATYSQTYRFVVFSPPPAPKDAPAEDNEQAEK